MSRVFGSFAGVAVVGLLGMSVAQAAVTRADAQSDVGGGSTQQCEVRVVRNNPDAGVYAVTRQVLDSGNCVCHVRTGPANQGGQAESSVLGILQSRSCSDAAPAVAEGNGATGGGAGGGGISNGVLGLVGAGVVGGVAAGVGGKKDSPGT